MADRRTIASHVVRMVGAGVASLAAGIAFAQGANVAFEDTMAQRMRTCETCHGDRGAGRVDSAFPRLAGQPAAYLAAQLRAFRDGRRTYAPMNFVTSRQSDAYLDEMATYFAAQTPDAAVVAARRSRPFDRAAFEAGRSLVEHGRPADGIPACKACHGASLMGMQPAIPALAGMPRDLMIEQVGSWKSGTHRAAEPDCMAQIARRMSGVDIAAAATWLSLQDPRGAPEPERALPIPCSAPGRAPRS